MLGQELELPLEQALVLERVLVLELPLERVQGPRLEQGQQPVILLQLELEQGQEQGLELAPLQVRGQELAPQPTRSARAQLRGPPRI